MFIRGVVRRDVVAGSAACPLSQEAELSTWTAFLQRAVDATYNTEVIIDNVQNLIAEQKRCVREVSSSSVFTSLCGASASGAGADAETAAVAEDSQARSPVARRALSAACSTPIARD
ncbi:unnamed protein product [Euphydryas editha]|uniref:Uncharacterized protein n=1 Tax=Euphydryas editha TaxID=104508 RepID=A0AAU9U1D7_EUPED|nr:unnamed protein product [Euphydryas editha]